MLNKEAVLVCSLCWDISIFAGGGGCLCLQKSEFTDCTIQLVPNIIGRELIKLHLHQVYAYGLVTRPADMPTGDMRAFIKTFVHLPAFPLCILLLL